MPGSEASPTWLLEQGAQSPGKNPGGSLRKRAQPDLNVLFVTELGPALKSSMLIPVISAQPAARVHVTTLSAVDAETLCGKSELEGDVLKIGRTSQTARIADPRSGLSLSQQ